ncbi:MAG: ammonium transporter [Nakamurella sp.]
MFIGSITNTSHDAAAAAVSAATALTTDQVNTLWLLVATVLALLMAPGVAFFYGGLVRETGVVNMMMMSFGAMAVVGVIWALYGYSVVFGHAAIPHWFGNPLSNFALGNVTGSSDVSQMHTLALAGFHAAFAIDVVALISGAIADRARFGAWLLFAAVWVTVVYFPVARWIFNKSDGWAALAGVHDFAGGIAVHANAGAAALAVVLVIGNRRGFSKELDQPHNVPLMLLGTALLWIGWFGFNAGSEGAVDSVTVLASINTMIAPGAAALGWLAVEKLRLGKPSSIGAASGLVVGLVAAAPSCDVLTPGWTLVLGVVAGVICALVVDLRFKFGFDDSLNVVGIHLVGGVIGTVFVGIAGSGIGVIDTGSWHQFGLQVGVSVVVVAYSFGMAWVIATVIQRTIGFRAAEHEEISGPDVAFHGENGYVWTPWPAPVR